MENTIKKQEMLNRRAKDIQDEKIVGAYLDKHFYPEFCTTWNRNESDLQAQYRGEDITVTTNTGVKYVIDEKAATQYVGKNLQTFIQELSNINKAGNLQVGTYLNSNNTNDSYVYVWIDEGVTDDSGYHLLKREDGADVITDMTVILITKKDLKNYVATLGWDDRKLWDKQRAIREAYAKYGWEYYKYENTGDLDTNGCRFHLGYKFWECSCNLLLPRKELIKHATVAYRIKNQKIINLKS